MAAVTTAIAPANGIEIALRDPRRPRRRAAAAGHGPRRAADRAGRSSCATPSSTGASSSSATTTATSGLSTKFDDRGGERLHDERSSPATPGRAGRRCRTCSPTWPPTAIGAARPPRHRVGPRRRRVDGRDDRPDDGHRAPDAGAHAHVDHVDDRRARVRPAHARGAGQSCCSPRRPTREEAIASVRRDAPGDRQPGALRRGRWPRAGRRRPTTGASTRPASPGSCSPSCASGSRAEGLAQLDVPTLVIHGDVDPLVTPSRRPAHRRAGPRRRAAR